MNILVMGGTGYLGSKMCRALVNEGHRVVATRRNTSDLSRTIDINDKVKWIDASVNSIVSENTVNKFDFAINMICNYGKADILYDSVIDANLVFPLKVFNALVSGGVKRFLTIGTGLPSDFNMYSFSKELLAEGGRFFVDKHNISFYNVKLEMFYGSDEPENRFLPSVIKRMIHGQSVKTTVGKQKRDIIAVDDVIDVLVRLVMLHPNGYYDIPLGTGIAPSISEVIDYIWNKTGCKADVQKGAVPMRPDEPDCVANTELLKSFFLDWEPVSWKEGIDRMILEIKKQEVCNETIN